MVRSEDDVRTISKTNFLSKLLENILCNRLLPIVELAAALARHSGQEEGEACQHLFSRLSILLQKGNAAILLNRIPRYPEGVVDGDQELG